jgi:pimeloyl-ACP methyl ester carboxylesterase
MIGYRACFYAARDGLTLFYRDYPAPSDAHGRTPVLCLPGLTRNARDFDAIAAHIAETRRVLCADFRGRGRSHYDPDWRHYTVAVETDDMFQLLQQANIPRVLVLGTSRGGIVGMAMAGMRKDALAGIVLNDVGAVLEATGLQRIAEGLQPPARFADWDQAADALKRANAQTFADVADAQWQSHARALFREESGAIVPDRDPALTDAVLAAVGPDGKAVSLDLWKLFDCLDTIPALALRAANSDLLSAETLARMQAAKPDLVAVTVPGRGHVPFLDEPLALAAIDAFLAGVT